jgi:hypothetical protein
MAKRLALLFVLAAPSVALAQSITVSESTDQDRIINKAECNDPQAGITVQWTVASATATGGTFDVKASDTSSCPEANGTTTTTAVTKHLQDGIQGTSNSGTFPATGTSPQSITALVALLGISCNGANTAIFFCIDFTPVGGTKVVNAATGSVQLDLATPPPPIVNAPSPGDAALNVSWSPGSGAADAGTSGSATSYNIYYAPSGIDVKQTANPAVKKVSVTNTLSGRINGLANGTAYDVMVTGVSIGSNESGPSNVVTGTPEIVNDFWRVYRNDQGRETGGCAAGAAGMLALLAVPLALRAWRRKQS